MAETEVNVISHLLKVESDASVLVTEAKKEAAERVAAAKAKAEEEVRQQVDAVRSKLEAEYNSKIQSISENHKKIIDEYKSGIESVQKDTDAFNSFLTKVLNS
ncbi:MAG: hypothetical protein II367_06090 [Treponema sp.]|nr:hypothetical protein [Treponema sp.]